MKTTKKLTYEGLKLGEAAKDAYLRGETPEKLRQYPIYLNTREVYKGLNVTDLAIAAVLARIPLLLVGDTGCGKSQLVQDMYNHYFNGDQIAQGRGVKIRGRNELDIHSEIYTRLDREELARVPTESVKALLHWIDEINRCPEKAQNQFFGLGDGYLEHAGTKLPLGSEGYSMTIATANIGNGEFKGTFDIDRALKNRFGVVIDLDHTAFRPTTEDEFFLEVLRPADPKLKEASLRDISDLIISGSKDIDEKAQYPGLEALAVIGFLRNGLRNCPENRYNSPGEKGKNWPYQCQDCPINGSDDALCSLLRDPVQRTLQSTIRYAEALEYLALLKNPEVSIDPADLMFKAFELTGAYQGVLNRRILKQAHDDQNPIFMASAADKLKEEFRKHEPFIMTALYEAEKGKDTTSDFYNDGKETGYGYGELPNDARKGVTRLDPFNDKGVVGLGWVKAKAAFHNKLEKRSRQ
jgi:hypothetical protein